MAESSLYHFVKKYTVYNAMLFVSDIYRTTKWKGILFHKNIPIRGITVIGIVIEVCKKEKVVYVKVHDGTASIKCVFFMESIQAREDLLRHHRWTSEFKEKKTLNDFLERSKKSLLTNRELELGTLLQVCGDLKHEKMELICNRIREIDLDHEGRYLKMKLNLCSQFYDMEINWRQLYDNYIKDNLGVQAVKFLRRKSIPFFSTRDLADLLHPMSDSSGIHAALKDMREAGFMFKLDQSKEVFQIVEMDQDVKEFIMEIIRDSQDESEDGVTSKYIFSRARKKYLDINLQNVRHCLVVLEAESRIYSTCDGDHFREC